MRLRTLAGAHAGEIRDYAFGAAQAALKAGLAERIEAPSVPTAPQATAADTPREPLRTMTRRRGSKA